MDNALKINKLNLLFINYIKTQNYFGEKII